MATIKHTKTLRWVGEHAAANREHAAPPPEDVHEWDCPCWECDHQRAVEDEAHQAYVDGIESLSFWLARGI